MLEAEQPESPLVMVLLGAFDVRLHGHPLPRLRSQKSQWLLALLALQRGRAVERTWLAGTLWPDSSTRQATFNLNRNLTDLRRAFGPESGRLASPTRRTVRLDLAGAEVDVLIFDEAIARGDAPSLERAVALHRGPLLLGWDEEWILHEREARQEGYRAALESLAATAVARHDGAAAIRLLRRLVAADPLRDSAHRDLMQALAAAGDLPAATHLYRDFRLRLHQELNAAPDPATTALYQQLRAEAREGAREGAKDGPKAGAVAPPSLTPSPGTGPTPSAPPSPSLARPLPRPVSTFVGREQEIEEVAAALAVARVVTLTGAGGVGKTRLALRVAEKVAREYPDGVGFVDLAALVEPALVPRSVAEALGIGEDVERTPTEMLLDALQPRRLLLVLDNCEHLLDACAHLAAKLVSACPDLSVLATSRQALGITGETDWRVAPLSLPDPGEVSRVRGQGSRADEHPGPLDPRPLTLDLRPSTPDPRPSTLLQYDAVRLFVERARSAVRTFRLDTGNAEAVVEVCDRLDGIPLAIELAAARLKGLSVRELAQRLEDRFFLLTQGSRTAPPRQRTLRATLDWSHELLTAPERALLRRVAVFAGGWTLEAAEAVCSGAEGRRPKAEGSERPLGLPSAFCLLPSAVLDLLTALVDKSLVQHEECEGEDEGRYRLLETVRQYGQERLRDSGEEGTVRARHQEFYLRLAEQAESGLAGRDQVTWLERLEASHDNLRTALDWSLANAPERALRLCAALAEFWKRRSHVEEGRRRLEAALEQAGSAACSRIRARALDGAGVLAYLQGDCAAADTWYRGSLETYRQLGDQQGIARALYRLGRLADLQGDPVAARALLEESLGMQRELGDHVGVSNSLIAIANLLYHEGSLPRARDLYRQALAISRDLGNLAGIAAGLAGLGHVACRQGEYLDARAWYEESLTVERRLGARYEIAHLLVSLGSIEAALENYGIARAHVEVALAIHRELHDRPGIAAALAHLGDLARAQGDYAAARRFREESLILWRALGARTAVMHCLGALGHLAREQRQLREAREFYTESLLIRWEVGDTVTLLIALEDFAELAEAEQEWAQVARLLGAVTALRGASGHPPLPRDLAEQERLRNEARRALGSEAFAEASSEGEAMTLEAALACALESH